MEQLGLASLPRVVLGYSLVYLATENWRLYNFATHFKRGIASAVGHVVGGKTETGAKVRDQNHIADYVTKGEH